MERYGGMGRASPAPYPQFPSSSGDSQRTRFYTLVTSEYGYFYHLVVYWDKNTHNLDWLFLVMENITVKSPPSKATKPWHRLALGAILILSAILNFYKIAQEGLGNQYYAAAVKSMLMNWHNFFFNSFDPAGFVSVDKPPLGLWVQVASAKVFGFEGWALMLPQALAGVLSVLVIYFLVKRIFGSTAGLIAAFVLAITPISVAANRNNTMDSLLVLTSLLAAWAISIAAEKGKLRWLLLCSVLVGIGFNIKMLQAYLVLPAFFLLYLFAAPLPVWKRIVHLALAGVVLLVISLSWAVAVDLIPPDERPYVGSSQDNTVMELIIGHNGMSRLLPGGIRRALGIGDQAQVPLPPGQQRPQNLPPLAPGNDQSTGQPVYPPTGNQPVYPPAGNLPQVPGGQLPPYAQQPSQGISGDGQFTQETGERGLLRLFNRQLAGQVSWLLPLAFLGAMAIFWQKPLERRFDSKRQAVFLWVLWLLPQMAFFSYANLFHRYYLCMVAPGIAALVGAGMVALWNDYKVKGWRGWLLPVALVLTAALQAVFLAAFPDWNAWLMPLILTVIILTSLVLFILRLMPSVTSYVLRFISSATVILGLLALLLAPFAWSLTPILYGGDTALPFAGPDLEETNRRPPDASTYLAAQPLYNYLLENWADETYLLATLRASDAAPYILASGEPVMAMGGFSGSDPILTSDELLTMIQDGEVRFFLLTADNNQQVDLLRFIRTQCQVVPSRAVGLPSQPQAQPGGQNVPNVPQLFDCGNLRD